MKLSETGLTAEELKGLVKKYMIETYERFDFIAETAKDMYIYDEKGNAYLDFYAGIAVNSAGNCNEKVVKAIQSQAADLIHTFNYPYTIPQALLAKKICDTIGMDKIYYQNSGTEANEAMIKLARKYGVDKYGPEKYEIVTAKMGFHGRSFGSMSATGQPDSAIQQGFGPMTPGFKYAEYNNLKAFEDAITDKTIAIMIEPVQGEGGVHPATKEFMTGLRKLCDERGLLLCLDEVQSGWCRTGEVMAYMHYGIKPDIVSMAKAMGGGLPIGAICAKDEVAKYFTSGSHGSTYSGNPVACAASLAQIGELLDRDLAGNAKKMGEYFMNKGRDVLIVYDDLSKHAIAYRAMSLLLERSPGREAYPGDVFYLHSRLLERAAHLSEEKGGGSITALPIIETQSGDVSAYIPTNVISITDGQLILETRLFFSGQRPAVNVGLSVSRVGGDAQTKAMKKAAKTIRLDLSQYREMESFTQFASDLDESTAKLLSYGQGLMRMLRQKQFHPYKQYEQVILLVAGLNHVFQEIVPEQLDAFIPALLQHFGETQGALCNAIEQTGQLSDDQQSQIIELAKEFVQSYFSK